MNFFKALLTAFFDTLNENKEDLIPVAVSVGMALAPKPSDKGIIRSRFLFTRLEGLPKGTLVSTIPSKKNFSSRLVIQEHQADRAGKKHYDYRFKIGNKAISFVTKKGVPEIGERFQMFRQPDHTIKYMDFEGDIEDGYGKGLVSKWFESDIYITKTQPDEIEWVDSKGRVFVLKQIAEGNDGWLLQQKNLQNVIRLDKQNYSGEEKRITYALTHPDEFIFETKRDGAQMAVEIKANGSVSIVSHRISVNGSKINRTHNFPEVKNFLAKLPKNTILQGELVYIGKDGKDIPGRISGLANSLPLNAIKSLDLLKDGKVDFIAFDIQKLEGKDVSKLPYSERRELLENLSRKYKITIPEKSSNGFEFYKDQVSKGYEGIVAKPKDQPWGFNNNKMVKIKEIKTIDCKIIGFVPGTGKYKDNGIGSFLCVIEDTQEGAGNSVKVGIGLSDFIRRDAFTNPNKYQGQTIEIEVEDVSEKAALKPRLIRFHVDKNLGLETIHDEQDLLDYAKAINPDDPNSVLFAMKSVAGWKRK